MKSQRFEILNEKYTKITRTVHGKHFEIAILKKKVLFCFLLLDRVIKNESIKEFISEDIDIRIESIEDYVNQLKNKQVDKIVDIYKILKQ